MTRAKFKSTVGYEVIPEFRGEYYFLSNYYESEFVWRNIQFRSAEQAFAYAKTFFASQAVGDRYREEILNATSPGDAKRLGRKCKISVDEWDQHKVQYMREIVRAKFRTGEGLPGRLINTGASMLVEGNDWGDDFWGRCKKDGKMVGLNVLGSILMETRGQWLGGVNNE